MAIRGAGGTTGGIGQFFLGLALAGLGFYLFLDRVNVMSNFQTLFGGHGGLFLLPLGLGVGLLFFSARSVVGWVLVVGSLLTVTISIVANLTLFFRPTNFLQTAGMVALIATGFIAMIRSLRPS
jgi:uncharacterized protein